MRNGLLKAQGWKQIDETEATSAAHGDEEVHYAADEIATMQLCGLDLHPENWSRQNVRVWTEGKGVSNLVPDADDLFPEMDAAIEVAVTRLEETGKAGDGGWFTSGPGDPYFVIRVGDKVVRSDRFCFSDVAFKENPYKANLNVPDDQANVTVVIEAWDYDTIDDNE